MAGFFTSIFINQNDFAVAIHDDRATFAVHDDVLVLDLQLAVERSFDRVLLRATLRRTTDVEGTHRKLGSRFANRLRRDNTDGFADIDRRTARQIAPIALGANTDFCFAGQRRADRNHVDTRAINCIDLRFFDQIARRDNNRASLGVNLIDQSRASKDAFGQRRDDFAAFDDRLDVQALVGAAIDFGDDGVLRHIHQTTRQITRIRGLERRIRQPLTRAMGRVEIFKNGQTFLEVRDDGRFDDFAVRLCHQTAHTRQLFNLSRRTTRTGMRHHVNGVDVTFTGIGNALHHFFRNFFGAG